MRVAIVCPYSLSVPGGVQNQVLGFSRALRNLGVDARVIAPCDGPPPEPGIISVGSSRRWPGNGSVAPITSTRASARLTLEALRRIEPDVVHLHEPLVPGPTHAALLGSDAPKIGTFHAAGELRAYRYFRKPLRRMMQQLTLKTAVSQEAANSIIGHFGGRCFVIPNGVDVETFAHAKPVARQRNAIVFVGRHEQRKGLAVLLDAFEKLNRDAELWVIGQGPETMALKKRNIENVIWLGRVSVPELASRVAGASVLAAPSLRGESFGVILLEAMAAGTPVVASALPGYRLAAGDTAIFVSPGDSVALSEALGSVIDDLGYAELLRGRGRNRVAQFAFPALAEKLIPLYETAVSLGPA